MTPEEKQLLLQDLCARLPYEVKVIDDLGRNYTLTLGNSYLIDLYYGNGDYVEIPIKPCLRPMSSMTDKEKDELYAFINWVAAFDEAGNLIIEEYISGINLDTINRYIDWLNVHHFDYRGLISMGLALPAPEGMYD